MPFAGKIYYREAGRGVPLVFLHGGWGYEVYPFDRAIVALSERFRILIPDRSGYGRSPRLETLPPDFHQQAADETQRFLDALAIERAVLWGHSDGAVIAALMGLATPERCMALILEAFHYTRAKTGSVDFFRRSAREPESLKERTRQAMVRDHGEDHWRKVIERNASAWLRIAEGGGDLYHGRLSQLVTPALFIHGGRDPRTEPGELGAVRAELPRAVFRVLEQAGHSPHSEPDAAEECMRAAAEFLQGIL